MTQCTDSSTSTVSNNVAMLPNEGKHMHLLTHNAQILLCYDMILFEHLCDTKIILLDYPDSAVPNEQTQTGMLFKNQK